MTGTGLDSGAIVGTTAGGTTAFNIGTGAGGAGSRPAKMRYPTYQPASARPRTTIAPNCKNTFLRISPSVSAGGTAFFTGCADLGPSKYSARGIPDFSDRGRITVY